MTGSDGGLRCPSGHLPAGSHSIAAGEAAGDSGHDSSSPQPVKVDVHQVSVILVVVLLKCRKGQRRGSELLHAATVKRQVFGTRKRAGCLYWSAPYCPFLHFGEIPMGAGGPPDASSGRRAAAGRTGHDRPERERRARAVRPGREPAGT